MKITVKEIKVKKQTPEFTISEVTTDIGEKLDTFDALEIGKEYDGTIKENSNPQYNANFKLDKPKNGAGKTFPVKDYTFEKKKVALECAVQMRVSDMITDAQFKKCRDEFFEYLNAK